MTIATDQIELSETTPRAENIGLAGQEGRHISAVDWNCALEMGLRFAAPVPSESPFDWCVRELVLDDAEVKGRFDPNGRQFLRDIINDNNDDDCREQTLICGTGVGKTLSNIGGICWKIKHRPCRGLMVMPATKGEGGSETFVSSRLIPSIEATPSLAMLMPAGQKRLFMNSKKVRLNGCHFGFVGANSSSQIASNRCGDIRMDEADKYKGKLGNEAGTGSLVKERVEGVTDYQIFTNTTPTIDTGLGWKSLLRSDFRRRFLCCPHCNSEVRLGENIRNAVVLGQMPGSLKGWFALAWNEQYCVLPAKFPDGTVIPTAHIAWDKEAKRKDGSYDLARVFRSTRLECPHCGGHVRDENKIWMDANGIWIPTQAGTPHHKGYHLSSLYAPPLFSNENSLLGGRALKFLGAVEDAEGMRGFVNSTLAEVDLNQEHGRSAITLETKNFSQLDWTALMTADFQKLWPYLWFVVQKWSLFKLQPPYAMTNGRPDIAAHLDENPHLKQCCEKIIGWDQAAWFPLAELLRFTSRADDRWPLLDFCIAQGITGHKLVTLFREKCNANTLDLGRYLYGEMGQRMPKGGDSEIIAAGHTELSGDDAWQELRDYQMQFHVGEPLKFWGLHPNRAVMIDSGYAEEHNPEVLRKCFESGNGGRLEWYDPVSKQFSKIKRHEFCRPVLIDGWIPFKGYPITKTWTTGGIKSSWHWAPDDPFKGLAEANKYTVGVLEAASDLYFHRWMDLRERQKEIRDAMSSGKSYRGNIWSVANDAQFFGKLCRTREDFDKQMNNKGRNKDREIWMRGTGGAGSRRHPIHLNDCAVYQFALAEAHGFFSYQAAATNPAA